MHHKRNILLYLYLCAGLNAMQNLAALAAAASATQATPSGSSALTTSSSPLSALTSSGTARQQALSVWDGCKGSFCFFNLSYPIIPALYQ